MGVVSFCSKVFLFVVGLIVAVNVIGVERSGAMAVTAVVTALLFAFIIYPLSLLFGLLRKAAVAYADKSQNAAPLVFIFGPRGSELPKPYTWYSAIRGSDFKVVADAVRKNAEEK